MSFSLSENKSICINVRWEMYDIYWIRHWNNCTKIGKKKLLPLEFESRDYIYQSRRNIHNRSDQCMIWLKIYLFNAKRYYINYSEINKLHITLKKTFGVLILGLWKSCSEKLSHRAIINYYIAVVTVFNFRYLLLLLFFLGSMFLCIIWTRSNIYAVVLGKMGG